MFWNAARARNWVKELGLAPTNYAENMAQISRVLGVNNLEKMNPIEAGQKLYWDEARIEGLLGKYEYNKLSLYRMDTPVFCAAPIAPGPSVLEQRVRQLEINSSVMYARIEELERNTAALTLLCLKSH